MKEKHAIVIDESQRQAVLLALAHLTVERPGWEFMLTEIAKKMDNVIGDVPELYTRLLVIRRQRVSNSLPEEPTEDSFKQAVGIVTQKPENLLTALKAWRSAEVHHAAVQLELRAGDETQAKKRLDDALRDLRITTDDYFKPPTTQTYEHKS